MNYKSLFIQFLLTVTALAQVSSSGKVLEGTVYTVESNAVYVRVPDSTAIKVPLSATFLVSGHPVPVSELRVGQAIVVHYPSDSFEVLTGPLAPNTENPYFHRSIKRGALVTDQNYVDGNWVDVPSRNP